MWKWGDYQCIFVFDLPASKVFESLTADIPQWWSSHFEGESDRAYKIFTVRFGSTYKTMLVTEIIPNKKVVWEVSDSFIDSQDLVNKREWVGTRIQWEIFEDEEVSTLVLTHKGLNASLECFGICENGWINFTDSLSNYLNTGQGQPYEEKTVLPGPYRPETPVSFGAGTPVNGKLK